MLDMLTYLNLIMDLKRLRSGLRLSETVISVQGPKFSVALSERATARNNRVVRNNHGEFEERETIITVVRGVSNKNGEKMTFQHTPRTPSKFLHVTNPSLLLRHILVYQVQLPPNV